jgi:hypothetical protein
VNGDSAGGAPLFDEPPRYLPDDLASYLRSLMATLEIVDGARRLELVGLFEEGFHSGYAHGYRRGHLDGAATRDAEFEKLAHSEPVAGATLVLPQVPGPIEMRDGS